MDEQVRSAKGRWGGMLKIVMFAVAVSVALAVSWGGAEAQEEGSGVFSDLGTFEVPGGGVAEIVDSTPDGETLVYTNSDDGTVGFVDLSDAANPQPAGEPVDCRG